MNDVIKSIPLSELHSFPDNPFHVAEGDELDALIESVREYGIICPLVVRPMENGGYEIISGHRRKAASERAGLETVPAFVREMDRDAAVITLVDSNLHREHILPSERAFAYKMKLEALSRQGQRTDLTSTQPVSKLRTNEVVGAEVGESREQVRRYIRLTYLIPEILGMVDEGRIAFTPAVELSYLSEEEQRDLLDAIDTEDRTPSYSQSVRIKKLSQEGQLDAEKIGAIMSEDKPNQVERIRLPADRVRKFFPASYTPKQMEDVIMKLLENWQRQQLRKKNDAR